MDAYDRCTNLGERILPIVLPSTVEVENFSDHPRIRRPEVCHSVVTYQQQLCSNNVNVIYLGFSWYYSRDLYSESYVVCKYIQCPARCQVQQWVNGKVSGRS